MANRWGARTGPPPPENEEDESTARGEGVLPPDAVESWRTWLLTGKSGVVSDRRRLRGSHRGLKQMLVDGTGHEMPPSWKHFSGAMVRLAINDALNALPKDQTHAVWLAYFGGLSNSEIARRLGISVGAVERRLKLAFEYLSEYVEHGRTAGRRAVFAVLGFLSLRRLGDSWRHVTDSANHTLMTSAVELVRAYVQAHLVDRQALAEAQEKCDALVALATLKQAFTTDVSPILAIARQRAGGGYSERAATAASLAAAASVAAASAVPASSSLGVAGVDHDPVDRRDAVVARRDEVRKHRILRHRIRTEVTPVIGRGVDDELRRVALEV